MSFSRPVLVVLLASAAVACGVGEPTIDNIVVISLDTCRADALGCYGNQNATTPHTDALAESGVLFETAISPVPITMPAHASLFTGLIPPHHGVRDNLHHRLDEGKVTLAEMLAERIEASAGFVSARVLDSRFGISQGFDTWDDELIATPRSLFGAERRASETVDRAIGWLEGRAGEPFLLFVHLYDPHEPYEPPEPFASRFADDPYWGEVAYADAQVGRLLEALDRLGLQSNTAIVVAGDHGELLGEHGELTHTYFVYRNAVRVPLIMRIPGVDGGRRVAGTVGLVDVAPTLCGLLGVTPPATDGHDLSPVLLAGEPGQPDREIYSESLTPTRYGANPLRSLRTSSWSYIRSNRPELFDLALDPGETANLVGDRVDLVRRFESALDEASKTENVGGAGPRAIVDSETAEQLASLGYMTSAVDVDIEFDPQRPDPKDLIALHNAHQRTFLAMADGRWSEAEEACLQVLEEQPEFWEAVSNLAKITIGQRRWAEALPLLERALEIRPEQYEIIHDQGLALTELGDLEGAVEAFRRADALDPAPPTAALNLSRALFNLGEVEEALVQAERVAGLAAKNYDMLHLLGGLLLEHRQSDAAIPVYEAIIKLQRDDLEARNTLGLILADAGRLDAARAQFEALIDIDPGYAGAHLNLGMIVLQRSDSDVALEAAAAHFARAANSEPDLAIAHYNLAITNLNLGRIAEAIAGLRRTLELAPDEPEVLDQLAWLLIDAPDPNIRNSREAVQLAERACALTSQREPILLATLAAANAANGDMKSAAAVARRGIELARAQGRPELARRLELDLARYR